MPCRWTPTLPCAFALAAGCNWLAGIDEREAAQASGGEAGARADGGHSGRTSQLGGASSAGTKPTGDTFGGHESQGGTAGGDGESGEGAAANVGTDAGVGGAPGRTSGGATASGGTRASAGGAAASTGGSGVAGARGGAGGRAGTAGSAGSTAKGGSAAGGNAGAGGSTPKGPCLGYPNELPRGEWYINTGPDDGSIKPITTAEPSGLFPNGACVCVSGERNPWAILYFQNTSGFPFSTLDLKLISSPGSAMPTIYIHTKNDNKRHCLILRDDQELQVNQGKTLQLTAADFRSDAQCKYADPDIEPDSVIDEINLEFNTYEPQNRTRFELCVLNVTVR